jgi:hypothetical protein
MTRWSRSPKASILDPELRKSGLQSIAIRLVREKGLEERAIKLGFQPLPDIE